MGYGNHSKSLFLSLLLNFCAGLRQHKKRGKQPIRTGNIGHLQTCCSAQRFCLYTKDKVKLVSCLVSYHAFLQSAKVGTIRPIRHRGDPLLAQVAAPVRDPEAVGDLIADLLVTMQAAHGVGIAAPQIGVGSRVIVVASRPNRRYPDAPQMDPVVMINPEIVAQSAEQVWGEEGCLSVPNCRGQVLRSQGVVVRFWDPQGQPQEQEWSGFIARIIQHEVDHLQGTLFVDRQPRQCYQVEA